MDILLIGSWLVLGLAVATILVVIVAVAWDLVLGLLDVRRGGRGS